GNFGFADLAHQSQEIVMSDQIRFVGASAESWSRLIQESGFDERAIGSSVIVCKRCIDNGPNRLIRQFPYRSDSLRRHLFVTGIDDQHSVVADLHSDTASRPTK